MKSSRIPLTGTDIQLVLDTKPDIQYTQLLQNVTKLIRDTIVDHGRPRKDDDIEIDSIGLDEKTVFTGVSDIRLTAQRSYRAGELILDVRTDAVGSYEQIVGHLIRKPWSGLLYPRLDTHVPDDILIKPEYLPLMARILDHSPTWFETESRRTGESVETTVVRTCLKVQHNAFYTHVNPMTWRCLFPIASFLQNDCNPNAYHVIDSSPDKDSARLRLYARQDIERGETLTVSYMQPVLDAATTSTAERRRVLGFVCQCKTCANDVATVPFPPKPSWLSDSKLCFTGTDDDTRLFVGEVCREVCFYVLDVIDRRQRQMVQLAQLLFDAQNEDILRRCSNVVDRTHFDETFIAQYKERSSELQAWISLKYIQTPSDMENLIYKMNMMYSMSRQLIILLEKTSKENDGVDIPPGLL